MSEVKQSTHTAQRYQNPEVFERLAMEYALGTLHGKARKRFEKLMDRHLFMRATVESYENKFANLTELLPEEKPSNKVWDQLEKHIQQNPKTTADESTSKAKEPWWSIFSMKMAGLAASLLLVVSVSFTLLPTSTVEAQAYVSVLKSEKKVPMVKAMAKKGEGIHVTVMEEMEVPDNMKLTLWCLPKKAGEKPMAMGTISKKGNSMIKIDKTIWQGLADVSALAISVEPMDNNDTRQPKGDILYKGSLEPMTESS